MQQISESNDIILFPFLNLFYQTKKQKLPIVCFNNALDTKLI